MRIRTKIFVLAAGLVSAISAFAQSWPSRPIRVLVGYNAGTSPDLVARITGSEISKRLGQPMVIEIRPGAAGHIANIAVARAAPDGYTILSVGQPFNSEPLFIKTDPVVVGKDLATLGAVASTPIVLLVRGTLGIKNFQELVAYSKKNPGKLNYAAISTSTDLMLELVKARSGLTFTSVPYKGAPVAEMLRDEVDMYSGTMLGLAQHVQAGKIVPVLSLAKSNDYPNVQTAVEIGLLDTPIRSQLGYYGPANLPRDMVQKFSQSALASSKTPEVIEGLRKLGLESDYQSPDDQLKEYEARMRLNTEAARMVNFKP